MKNLFFFIAVLVFYSCGSVEPTESTWKNGFTIPDGNDSNLSDSLKSVYKADAEHLALRDIHSVESEKNSLVEIPGELINMYYSSLIHVYNKYYGVKGLIGAVCNIHVFPEPETHRLLVSADMTKQWVKNFLGGNSVTGYKAFDDLVATYKLKQTQVGTFSNIIVLYSENALNILALSNLFKNLDGVNFTEPDGIVGDGNDIKSEVNRNQLNLTYYLKWGDCPAGCISHHYWKLRLDRMGNVEFIDEGGDPIGYHN